METTLNRTTIPNICNRKWQYEPKPYVCGACEEEITPGQLFVDLTDSYLCIKCLEEMSPIEIVRMCGYEINQVEFPEKTGKVCVHFRGIEDCICNNDPDDPGECVYENGIEPPNPSAPCKYYTSAR